ncbi:MAG: DUF4364 family protein [Clostridia bacterium]|nr:DUF4364 family protein [Clostridia bacterium]
MGSQIGSRRNVKIFVLYLMENINYPMDFVTINDIVMQTDYIIYLDFAECFYEMVDDELILVDNSAEDPLYYVSEKGRVVARELKSDILASVLDQSLRYALRYLDFKRRGIVSRCVSEKLPDGRYRIDCSLTEKGVVIYSTSLVVDTELRVEQMKANFYDRTEVIYRGVTALLAGQVDYLFDW